MGAVAAFVILVDPLSFIAVVGVLALIVFHLVAGSQVYRPTLNPTRFDPPSERRIGRHPAYLTAGAGRSGTR